MKRQDYYPGIIAEQVLWLRHFAAQLQVHAARLELTAEQVTGGVGDALWVAYLLGVWSPPARAWAKSVTSALEHAQTGHGGEAVAALDFHAPPLPAGVTPRAPGALKRVFKLVRVIKHQAGYTTAIGADLGLLTRADDREHPAPDLELDVERGTRGEIVVLRLIKWGHKYLHIESRRGGGNWEEIGLTSLTRHEDKRPLLTPGQPELREYRARFFEDDSPTGEWSTVGTITVSP